MALSFDRGALPQKAICILEEYKNAIQHTDNAEKAMEQVLRHQLPAATLKRSVIKAYEAAVRLSPYAQNSFQALMENVLPQGSREVSSVIVPVNNYFYEFERLQSVLEDVENTTT
ncbi:hypothetical protein [Parendozoicomonas sp. Alg238-R29]|uniref:hypothetical protein n=1 Tax=Parendozoicomonas sp. Alg238-R29 TaxID=2993446 RepID=UPI00248D7C94|nr:hypothetical protein [Parendozoicomonas sp. Alg238-R29]